MNHLKDNGAGFTFKTDTILEGVFPDPPEPTYDITFTVICQRIWWKPGTWRKRSKTYTFEHCTLCAINDLQAIFRAEASN